MAFHRSVGKRHESLDVEGIVCVMKYTVKTCCLEKVLTFKCTAFQVGMDNIDMNSHNEIMTRNSET